MAYRQLSRRGLGQSSTLWQDFLDFWNPSLPTSTVAANVYQRAQYGNIPVPTTATVPGGAAPGVPVSYDPATGTVSATNTSGQTVEITDPQARAQALTDLINQAIASGDYNPAGAPLATDVGSIPSWVWWVGGGLVGTLVLTSLVGGRS